MLVFLSVLITFIVTSAFIYQRFENESNVKYVVVPGGSSEIGTEISSIRTIIDKYYLGEIDEQKLKEGAIAGYVEGLGDDYSVYITKDDYEKFSENVMGSYVGIGIYMAVYKDTNEIVVVSPIKNSPAEKVGLAAGDIIDKVDGVKYEGSESLDMAASKIKGIAGTSVHLDIIRGEENLSFDIVREKIIINPVTSELLENNIGYIQVTSFDENCSLEFKEKYEELSSKGIKSLIIDLRNNGGGIVQEALTMVDYILPKDETIMITVNKTEEETTKTAKTDPIITIPVVVLVNENSASASEIFVGALKDHNMAKVVGTKTYGKGVIQEILKLTDGSALKLTIEEYYTPKHNKINKVGITPDVEVKLPEEVKASNNIEKKDDTQLMKAIEMLK